MPGLLISGPVVGAMRRDSNGTCYEPPNIPADIRCCNLERITKFKRTIKNNTEWHTRKLLLCEYFAVGELVAFLAYNQRPPEPGHS